MDKEKDVVMKICKKCGSVIFAKKWQANYCIGCAPYNLDTGESFTE